MSSCSLWVMDKRFYGTRLVEFDNSWLFSPAIWDVLLDKYLPYRNYKLFDGRTVGFLTSTMTDTTLCSDLNKCLNYSDNLMDRIAWEISNERIFHSKDKKVIADGLRKFVEQNKKYGRRSNTEGVGCLEKEDIRERFYEIADSILMLNEEEHPYFMFEVTSCEANVESWFENYVEETDEIVPQSLAEVDSAVTSFVILTKDDMEFITNTNYFKREI